jgi:type VI secretion system protein ImpE
MTLSTSQDAGAAGALDLFLAGRLRAAVDAQVALVKTRPQSGDARIMLAELLCFAGELERADRQLDLAGIQDPARAPGLALFRQLLRGETARHQHAAEGRLPEFLAPPSDGLRSLLHAAVELRAGNAAGAAEAVASAEAQRPAAPGTSDGSAFDDCRDLDDLCGGALEVLTGAGVYLWVPLDRVGRLDFRPPRRLRDQFWRQALLTLSDGEAAEVFIPVLYAETAGDEQLALGRRTEWREVVPGVVRGVGQRCLLMGEAVRPLLSLGTVTFGAAP